MVCVPCFIIPVLLFVWHRFIQPYVLRFWNPWAVKDAQGNVVKTDFPFACEGGVCALKRKKDDKETDNELATEFQETSSCPGRMKTD